MDTPTTLSIKPSPRILRVLGDIEFEPWQCIAELIDNAFDDFLEVHRRGHHWPDGFTVSVSLPAQASADAVLVVEDTGRGMSLDVLNNAVRAGWSSNDRFSKLGLFGMGFNIATARLGRVTRLLTARVEDSEWVGVEIDLDRVGDDFDVPVIRYPKQALFEHGTRVEVTRLEPSRAGWLGKNAAKIRATLGDVYSYLLSEWPFSLYVDGVRVAPRRPCIWGDNRSVIYGSGPTAEVIPAIVRLDRALPDAEACLTCGNWQPPGISACSECGSTTLESRARRIHGWIGIQRHLHKSEFGIDFLRNGRKILRSDKRLFSWLDPNDPLAAAEVEYPVELGQGGRIVGEIHLDHVPVNYQKNAFEWSDRGWIAAARFLRGDGPLLPKRAKELGYPPNDSPLSRLHRGYRRNDPGYRCLVPGNGAGPIHGDTLEWKEKFHKGAPECLTDQKWWDAVVYHENKVAQSNGGGAPGGSGDILGYLGLGPTTSGSSTTGGGTPSKPKAPQAVPETEKERAERLKSGGEAVPSLSKEYGVSDLGPAIEVTAIAIKGEPLIDANGSRTPVLLWRESGKRYLAFIDVGHTIFQSFPVDPGVLLAVEIANLLRVRQESKLALAEVAAQLVATRLPDLRVEQSYLAGQARDLLDYVRQRMADAVAGNPERAWQHLSLEERGATETRLVVAGATGSLDDVQKTGEFLLYVPGTFLARLIEAWPEAFFDGKVFRGGHGSVTTAAGRHVMVGRIVSYIYDVAVVAEVNAISMASLSRSALSIQLLRGELAGGQ
jgi:hypothetical protein